MWFSDDDRLVVLSLRWSVLMMGEHTQCCVIIWLSNKGIIMDNPSKLYFYNYNIFLLFPYFLEGGIIHRLKNPDDENMPPWQYHGHILSIAWICIDNIKASKCGLWLKFNMGNAWVDKTKIGFFLYRDISTKVNSLAYTWSFYIPYYLAYDLFSPSSIDDPLLSIALIFTFEFASFLHLCPCPPWAKRERSTSVGNN